MPIDKILVGLGGVSAILFVAWFFFGKMAKAVAAEKQVQITVDGGYSPEVVTVKKGQLVTLNLYRKDPSDCVEEVVLSDFGVRRHLPLNQVSAI